jgi:hypothetical protein
VPTLFSVGAYRVVIFVNDHAPPHVHALGPDGHARFALGVSPEGVVLLESSGIPRRALARIAAEIIDRHAQCRWRWENFHGRQ